MWSDGSVREPAQRRLRTGEDRRWFVQDAVTRDALSRALPEGVPEHRPVETLVDRGSWVTGTPDDCIAAIDRLLAATLRGGLRGGQ